MFLRKGNRDKGLRYGTQIGLKISGDRSYGMMVVIPNMTSKGGHTKYFI